MNSTSRNFDFNPSGVGIKNGNFIGLPFDENTANVILIPVPWDVTVSFMEGTALAPQAILDASVQLDLYDEDIENAWKLGIYYKAVDKELFNQRNALRSKASEYIEFLEQGGQVEENPLMKEILQEIDHGCTDMNQWVYQQAMEQLDRNKIVGVVGGDHSIPLGYIQALAEKHDDFGILHIDAHMDLRQSYEGFCYSHASVFYNALKLDSVIKLVQLGIRDYCQEEVNFAASDHRIKIHTWQQLAESRFRGSSWNEQCGKIIEELPNKVYISFDADGLDPKLCPGTGTPVPGGFDFCDVIYLFKKLVESGRRIIGFDLCEVGNQEWDANVGARILYKLCNWTGRSQGII